MKRVLAMASGLLTVLTALLVLTSPAWPAPPAQAGCATTLVSIASDGTPGNGWSDYPDISADGRYVVFTSVASNLVPGDTNGTADIFVRDTQTGQTSRVSVASDGTQANGESWYQVISANGRYVAFQSSATNLVPGGTSDRADIFIQDLETGQTSLVSVAPDGTRGNNMSMGPPAISADGRYVAFSSYATNLAAGVEGSSDSSTAISYGVRLTPAAYPVAQTFIHDMQTGQNALVSVATDGTQGNDYSKPVGLSANGRYVAFESGASNLVPGDTNGMRDIFVRDMQAGQTTRVSVASDGTQTSGYSSGGVSAIDSISADGRYVVFDSDASNLVPGDSNGYMDVFVHDMQTGQTSRVSVGSDGTQADAMSALGAISGDGRYVIFSSNPHNDLLPGDSGSVGGVFVHDLQTGSTSLVSDACGGVSANSGSGGSVISADGRYVAFGSSATNLLTGDTTPPMVTSLYSAPIGSHKNVFVYDRGSVHTGGSGVMASSYLPLVVRGASGW